MACREPQHPPPEQCGPVEFIVISREPGSPGVPAPAGDPCPSIDLDGEQAVGPREVETPAPAEMPGERVLSHGFVEPRRPDQDKEPELEWRRHAWGLRPYAWTGWFNGGLRGDHGITMRPPVHPRGRGWSPDWGNPGRERRTTLPKPHHGRRGAGRRVSRGAVGCGRDAMGHGTRENASYLTSRSPVRSGH